MAVFLVLAVTGYATLRGTAEAPPERVASDESAAAEPTAPVSPSPQSASPAQPAHPQAQPPLIITAVNPLREIRASGGSRAYIFNVPVEELRSLPPDYNDSEFVKWAYDNGGVDADSTYVDLTVQGRDDTSVLLTDLTVTVTQRKPLPAGIDVQARKIAWAAPAVPIRFASVDLDESDPVVELVSRGYVLPAGSEWEFPLRISESEPENLRLQATTTRCYCTWVAVLHFAVDGDPGTVEINNGGEPFHTAASTNTTTYIAQPDGSLTPAQR